MQGRRRAYRDVIAAQRNGGAPVKPRAKVWVSSREHRAMRARGAWPDNRVSRLRAGPHRLAAQVTALSRL
jgi:hypothetical protein